MLSVNIWSDSPHYVSFTAHIFIYFLCLVEMLQVSEDQDSHSLLKPNNYFLLSRQTKCEQRILNQVWRGFWTQCEEDFDGDRILFRRHMMNLIPNLLLYQYKKFCAPLSHSYQITTVFFSMTIFVQSQSFP